MRIAHKITVLAGVLLVAAGVLCWYVNSAPSGGEERTRFVIEKGESLTAIAERLRAEGVVRSATFMRVLARINGADRAIQSGSYAIPADLATDELLAFLTTGQQLLIRVTIPEGKSISGVAAILERQGVAGAEEFVSLVRDPRLAAEFGIPAESMEGYLFPNTYFFSEDHNVEEVARRMIGAFYENIEGRFPELAGAGGDELHRVITMASMIEREYIKAEEAALISSVFHNRLERGQRLEACSTIVYIITEIEGGEFPSQLYFRDLERDSPYNTYRNAGLPPAPIANPGNIAIDAALRPADTDYFYFVLERAGASEHRFSKTFSEHSEARVIYIRSQR